MTYNPMDKPWMQPTQYTNDVDPSHGPQPGANQNQAGSRMYSQDEVEAMMSGQRLDREERSPVPGLGDGRPSGGARDNSPLVYKKAYVENNEIDMDEREYMEVPEEYVPVARPQTTKIHLVQSAVQVDLPPMNQPTNNTPSAPHERVGTQPASPAFMPCVERVDRVEQAVSMPHQHVILKSIIPRSSGTVLVISMAGLTSECSPGDLEAIAREMMGWAHAARLIKI